MKKLFKSVDAMVETLAILLSLAVTLAASPFYLIARLIFLKVLAVARDLDSTIEEVANDLVSAWTEEKRIDPRITDFLDSIKNSVELDVKNRMKRCPDFEPIKKDES